MAKSKSKRVGDFLIRVDARRGTDEAGRQYHRIVRYEAGKEVTAWSGWATPQEAQKHAAALIIEPRAAAPKEVEIQTIRDLCECFLGATQEDVKPRTFRGRHDRLKVVVRALGEVLVERFRLNDLEGFVRRRKGEAAASGTIWLELRLLRQAWLWAVARGHIPDKPMPKVAFKPIHQQGYTPEDDEIQRVLGVFRARGGWRYLAVLLLAETGARLGEIAGLKRKDVDRERMTLRLDGKTGARVVPVSAAVFAEIRPFLVGDAEGGLFGVRPTAVEAIARPTTEKLKLFNLEKACESAGVERFTPNALRRAFTIRCYRAGLDPALEASLAGHSIQMALSVYRQIKPAEQRQAIERIGLTRAQ